MFVRQPLFRQEYNPVLTNNPPGVPLKKLFHYCIITQYLIL